MDFGAFTIAALRMLCGSARFSSLIQYIFGISIAVKATKMIRQRKGQLHAKARDCGNAIRKKLVRYGPELLGLIAIFVVAFIIQTHGAMTCVTNAAEERAITSVMQRWPTLLTADSLLALQSMLRLLVLTSTVLRRAEGPTLLTGEVAAMSFAAVLARSVLVSRSKIYRLDGPLGGLLPAACDLFSAPLLALLGRNISRRSLTVSFLALLVAGLAGSQNRLRLADDAVSDGLFIFAHTAELLAAFAYLFRALLLDSAFGVVNGQSVALGFAHMMMPMQQLLSAYYFVETFQWYDMRAVGAGHPYEILRVGAMAQVLAYVGAAVLHFVHDHVASPAKELYLFTETTADLSVKAV